MYHLVAAKVKTDYTNGDWWEEDLSTVTIRDIIDNYRLVHLMLTNDVILTPLFADFFDFLSLSFLDVSMTLPDWFASIGSSTLPTSPTFPTYESKTVQYRDAFQSLFSVQKVHPTIDPEIENTPDGDKIDLLLSKNGLTQYDIADYCLVSVNGFMHFTEANDRGLYVRNGAEKILETDERNVGIYSFAKLGKLTLKPLSTLEMFTATGVVLRGFNGNDVYPLSNDDYSDTIFIDVGESLINKSVLLSVGGYFHAMDNVYSIVGETTIKLDFKKIPFARRLLESKKYINLSSLNLTENPNNTSAMAVEEILTNATVQAYLNLSQSFLILVDSPNLYTQRHIMENGRLPGVYFHPETTHYPMMIDNGRLAEYLEIYEEQKTQYRIPGSNEVKRYLFETINWKDQVFIDSTKEIYQGQRHSDAQLLEIGSFLN